MEWQIAYLVVAGTVIAVLAWNTGIRLLGSQNGVLFFNLVPITTFAVEIARGYRFSAVEIAGATLAILALVGNNLYQRRAAARGETGAAIKRAA